MNLTSKIVDIIYTLGRTPLPPNPVFIFDIDDTLISTKTDTIIEPVFLLYEYVKKLGIQPVIITSRVATPENMENTIKQLNSLGITGFKYLYMMNINKTNPWEVKLSARKNVFKRGFKAVVSIGDKPWDIGEYGGIGYLIDP